MATKEKGEVKINLFGKDFTLKASIDAIFAVEELLGENSGLPKLAVQAHKGNVSFKTICMVIAGTMFGNGVKDYSYMEIAKEIRRNGMSDYIVPTNKLLGMMITKEEVIEEEKKQISSDETQSTKAAEDIG